MTEPTPAELNESAMNHFSRGDGIEAARQLQWALIGNPLYAEAWHNRAMVLRALADPFDALLCCDRAIEIDPCIAAYHNTKGVCWASMNQLSSAMECYNEAIENDPALDAAWHNKGSAAKLSGFIDNAIEYYEEAVRLRPTNADYRMSYAQALLEAGRLAQGWVEYESRFRLGVTFHRMMPLPVWEGQDGDIGLILYAEQGYGDAIQFMRFAPIIKNRSSFANFKVYVEVKKPLVELARTMRGFDGVIAYGEPLPKDATHCLPIMSAARLAETWTIDDIPYWTGGYFHVEHAPYLKSQHYWPHLDDGDNGVLKVGLCWNAGNRPFQPELKNFATMKSIAPHFLQPLANIDGVKWISLQVPIDNLPFPMLDFTNELHDFYETARLIKCLDVVVTVDTAVAHLAGALGTKTLLMTPRDNCWRWFGDRADSPWYPSLRQFRQHVPGDWPTVIADVIETLERFVIEKEHNL